MKIRFGAWLCATLMGLLVLQSVSALSPAVEPLTPAADRRGPDQTFLTFPEWFLVFSPAEFADFTHKNTPTDFPFLGHIAQFWQSYAAVTKVANANYEFNGGYHLMIMVIGTSTTVEYAIRAVYEGVVGRFSDLLSGEGETSEDKLGAKVAQDYVDFIRVYPWYEFDFVTPLKQVWQDKGDSAGGLLRKLERKYALTTEYGIKAVYGYLIKFGTKTVYDPALPSTLIVVDGVSENALPAQAKLVQALPDKQLLLSLPRYEGFMQPSLALAASNARFVEIAGNRSLILLSVINPADKSIPPEWGQTLFAMPVLTRPGWQRTALVLPVDQLAPRLQDLSQQGLQLEHIFDY